MSKINYKSNVTNSINNESNVTLKDAKNFLLQTMLNNAKTNPNVYSADNFLFYTNPSFRGFFYTVVDHIHEDEDGNTVRFVMFKWNYTRDKCDIFISATSMDHTTPNGKIDDSETNVYHIFKSLYISTSFENTDNNLRTRLYEGFGKKMTFTHIKKSSDDYVDINDLFSRENERFARLNKTPERAPPGLTPSMFVTDVKSFSSIIKRTQMSEETALDSAIVNANNLISSKKLLIEKAEAHAATLREKRDRLEKEKDELLDAVGRSMKLIEEKNKAIDRINETLEIHERNF